ncbi:carbohydrate esterase family 1 protein [Viridothelium virens]|uniref:feruloyl esterase n=1 Tax=Viridothelium virens TaxID=1048519 RepID=A0A6A6GXR6_VIRVR|nr:carbohydrate esterase family 1 protein [Viridothelium virens]
MKDKLKEGHAAPRSGARLVSPGSNSNTSTANSVPSVCSNPHSTGSTPSSKARSSSSSSTAPTPSNSTSGTTGCGKPLPSNLSPSGPSVSQTFTPSSGPQRTYRLYIPTNYNSSNPSPLLISYHGHDSSATAQEALTRFSNPTLNPNHIVIYPNGVSASWQGAPYAAPGIDDVAFSTELLADLGSRLCIDPERRYASGHSNGGGFVGTLACSEAGASRFAAFAASSGAFYQDAREGRGCDAEAVPKVPFLEVHGTADETIPYQGGSHAGECLPSLPYYVGSWAGRDELGGRRRNESVAVTRASGKATTRFVWDREETITHYQVEGLGHEWADGWGGFSTSPTMMEWFARWKLRGARV